MSVMVSRTFLILCFPVFSLAQFYGININENPQKKFINNSAKIYDLIRRYRFLRDPLNAILDARLMYPENLNSSVNPAEFLCKLMENWIVPKVSKDCLQGLRDFVCALGKQYTSTDPFWPAKVLDSMGKLPAGVTEGDVVFWPGDYKLCKNIDVEILSEDKSIKRFWKGGYCIAKMSLPDFSGSNRCKRFRNTVFLLHGICVPIQCNSSEMNVLFKKVFRLFNYQSCYSMVRCESEKKASVTTWVMLVFISIVIFLLLSGTYVDIFHPTIHEIFEVPGTSRFPSHLGWLHRFLNAFSLHANGRKLLSSAAQGQLQCVYGIRVLSMAYVILAHTYVFSIGYSKNPIMLLKYPKEFLFQIVNNGSLSVDSFFFLSGFLLSYIFLKRLQTPEGARKLKSLKFWLMYYIHRYLRLTPVYAIVIAVGYGFWDFLGNGPFWQNVDVNANFKTCPSNWWRNMLYINNLWNVTEDCIGWVWYLANDMQFYVLSPPLLLLLYFLPYAGVVVAFALAMGSCALRTYVIIAENHRPAVMVTINTKWVNDTTFVNDIYEKPWMRVGPYFVGIIFGWLVLATHGTLRIHKTYGALLWLFTFGLSFAVVFGSFGYARGDDISDFLRGFYGGFARTGWAVVVGCTVYLCLQGYGGFINSFFSSPVFIPLSRLTYCTYLVHEYVINYYYSTLNVQIYSTHYTMINLYLSNLCVSFGVALLFHLAFEAPFMQLEKLLFEHFTRKKSVQDRVTLLGVRAVHKVD